MERPSEAAPRAGSIHGGAKAAGGEQRERTRGGSGAGGEWDEAAQVGDAEYSSESESGEKEAIRDEREERDEQVKGHVATAAGAAVAAGRARGEAVYGCRTSFSWNKFVLPEQDRFHHVSQGILQIGIIHAFKFIRRKPFFLFFLESTTHTNTHKHNGSHT